ncbi:MAG: hypothetical protein LBV71_09765 [Prevotella sp.]|jgi:hypothetical protein|nr:hypothetical protein [Prevotella sp.]
MINLLKAVYSEEQPKFSSVPEYVGKTFEKIASEHTHYKGIPYHYKDKEALIVEIRLENSTLSCLIENEICTEAYQFPD